MSNSRSTRLVDEVAILLNDITRLHATPLDILSSSIDALLEAVARYNTLSDKLPQSIIPQVTLTPHRLLEMHSDLQLMHDNLYTLIHVHAILNQEITDTADDVTKIKVVPLMLSYSVSVDVDNKIVAILYKGVPLVSVARVGLLLTDDLVEQMKVAIRNHWCNRELLITQLTAIISI